ncbi:MAG: N-acetyltransferase [Actinomycetia bacterium]|nr:N-acetyltransferase [Actinomycetes bacterium]
MGSLRWPLFGLRVVTPRLELRYIDDELARSLAELAIDGVHAADAMPFSIPWTRQPPDVMRVEYPKHVWANRATFTVEDWKLNLAVMVDGEPVGVQDAFAKQFALTRQFETGSWLGLRHQGRGIGTEMRAAILHLGFEGLGAARATTGAWDDNPSSQAVTRKLGYTDNGWSFEVREGARVRMLRFAMLRDEWERQRRDDIVIEGLEPCLPLLGLDS